MSESKRKKVEAREEKRAREEKIARANRRHRVRALKARRRRRLQKRAVLEAGALGIRSARADEPNDYELSALGWLSLRALREQEPNLPRAAWLAVLPEGVRKKVEIQALIRETAIHPPREPWHEIDVHRPESGDELREKAGRWAGDRGPIVFNESMYGDKGGKR